MSHYRVTVTRNGRPLTPEDEAWLREQVVEWHAAAVLWRLEHGEEAEQLGQEAKQGEQAES